MDRKAVILGIRERWGDLPIASLSVRIAKELFELRPEEARFLTYETLLNLVKRRMIDEEFLAAINILTTSQFAILDAHGQFIDEDGNEYSIDEKEFEDLLHSNTLVHPVSGDVIEDAGAMVLPYFELKFED